MRIYTKSETTSHLARTHFKKFTHLILWILMKYNNRFYNFSMWHSPMTPAHWYILFFLHTYNQGTYTDINHAVQSIYNTQFNHWIALAAELTRAPKAATQCAQWPPMTSSSRVKDTLQKSARCNGWISEIIYYPGLIYLLYLRYIWYNFSFIYLCWINVPTPGLNSQPHEQKPRMLHYIHILLQTLVLMHITE